LPAIAVIAGWSSWRWGFVFVALLLLGSALAVQLACPNTKAPPGTEAPRPSPLADARLLWRERRAAFMLAANTLHQGAAATASTYTAALLVERYHVPVRTLALWLALVACGSVAGSLLGGRAARARPLQVAIASCALTALLAPVFFSGILPLALAALVASANGLAQSLRAPAHLAMVSDVAAENRSALLGLNATSNQTGYTLGAVLGGALLGVTGYSGIGLGAGAASILAGAIYGGVLTIGRRRASHVSRT
jgi:DHA1 family inner membrane transport protein